jgi:hypothetical protein
MLSDRHADLYRELRRKTRQRITAIMSSDPRRDWNGRDLARQLQIKPRNLLTQLAEWARLGLLARTGTGTYALLDTPP